MKQAYRIGIGHDIHALVENRDLWLGGVKIPFEKGLKGHSDADALVHAIMDALLGALALEDIGQLFPNDDLRFKNISSLKLLTEVMKKVDKSGYCIGNLDCIIHCEAPKIAPHRATIRQTLADTMKINLDQISIKAGTNEGFDSVGQQQAISCEAIVLLTKEFSS